MLRIGLTGGIGSGKSSVAARLAHRGALIIDADQISRDLVRAGQPAVVEIVETFGGGVLLPDGELDRAAMADIVFADADELARLNKIMHPRIAERTTELIAALPQDAVVVYDMPLLVETDAVTGWDAVVVVEAPLEMRLKRLSVDRGMAHQEAISRIAAQASDAERRAIADHVIANSGSLAELHLEVDDIWAKLTA